MSDQRIQELRQQIFDLGRELNELQSAVAGTEVPDYRFDTLDESAFTPQFKYWQTAAIPTPPANPEGE